MRRILPSLTAAITKEGSDMCKRKNEKIALEASRKTGFPVTVCPKCSIMLSSDNIAICPSCGTAQCCTCLIDGCPNCGIAPNIDASGKVLKEHLNSKREQPIDALLLKDMIDITTHKVDILTGNLQKGGIVDGSHHDEYHGENDPPELVIPLNNPIDVTTHGDAKERFIEGPAIANSANPGRTYTFNVISVNSLNESHCTTCLNTIGYKSKVEIEINGKQESFTRRILDDGAHRCEDCGNEFCADCWDGCPICGAVLP